LISKITNSDAQILANDQFLLDPDVYNDHHGLFDFQAFEVSDVFLVFQVLIVYVSLICHAFQV